MRSSPRETNNQGAAAVAEVHNGYESVDLTMLFAFICMAHVAGSNATHSQLMVVART
jgi:hypothetical protein